MINDGLGTWLDRRRARFGGRTAMIHEDGRTTFGELADQVDQLARGLSSLGMVAGDRVAYLGDNHPSFLQLLFAAGRLGLIFVPLNTRHTASELTYVLEDSGSSVLVHATAFSSVAQDACSKAAVGRRVVVAQSTEPITECEQHQDSTVAIQFHRLFLTRGDDAPDGSGRGSSHSGDRVVSPVGLDDPAMVLYTSGTTGRPKGAVLSHGNITWNCLNVITDLDIGSDEVALVISPMFHVASLDMGVLPTLLKGGAVILEPRFDPGRALDLIETCNVTFISGVPTTYKMLCEHPDWSWRDLSSLRRLTCGGSAVPHRVRSAYEKRGLSFTSGYGMTETAPGVTFLPADQTLAKGGSAGLPHFFTDVRIVGPDGEDVVAGDAGEILVKGPNVIPRYWNRPDATRESFTEDGWFRSGDIGYCDDDGFLYVSDRSKDMIISGGENIYPAEVEDLIIELDAVHDVAVIGVADNTWGEVPRAIVTTCAGSNIQADDVITHLDGRIARYKIPKSVVVVDSMPRTASGKIRKADLRQHYAQ